jgi:hypothetical protein
MEMDAAHTFLDVLSKLPFAKLVDFHVIRHGAGLMEFSEHHIQLFKTRVSDESVPIIIF